jgi:hypothetical protein
MGEPAILGRIRQLAGSPEGRIWFEAIEPKDARELVNWIDDLQRGLMLEFGCQCEPWSRTGGVHASDCALYEAEWEGVPL